MKENDLLRASLNTGATNVAPGELAKARQALADANQKLAEQTRRADKLAQDNKTLQSAASVNALEKAALEKRLQQRQSPATAAPSETSDEVKTLRARIAVDEAQAVPYTPEELALLKSPAPAPAPARRATSPQNSVNELPGGSALLVAEAQNYFSAGDYDKAEADYRQILQREPNNAPALANLAAIELQENKLADARDAHHRRARKNPGRRLHPFDLRLSEIPPAEIRRGAGCVEPRGASWTRRTRKSRIISASRWAKRGCARRRKRPCARRLNSTPIMATRTTTSP